MLRRVIMQEKYIKSWKLTRVLAWSRAIGSLWNIYLGDSISIAYFDELGHCTKNEVFHEGYLP